ncbi:MAG: autotransporter outer membrane beta-barrel domain-containing protein [Thermoguttaceae bacterium]|nr:autotransporter outer membrane beta-barrel domain-containing protein [Thermoguttaceae bacterium]
MKFTRHTTGFFTHASMLALCMMLSIPWALSQESDYLLRGSMGNLSQLPISPFRGRTTANVFGEWTNLDRTTEQPDQSPLDKGFKTGIWGGGIGRDRLFGRNILCGVGINALSMDITPNDPLLDGKLTSLSGNAHVSLFGELWFIDLGLGFGRNRSENDYHDSSVVYRNKYSGTQWNYNVDCGIRFRQGFTRIEPLLGLHASSLDEPSNANHFPISNSFYQADSNVFCSCRTLVGSRFSWEFQTRFATVSPMMYVTWLHEFGDSALFTTSELMPFPVAYRFGNSSAPRDRLLLSAGITSALRDTVDLLIYYNSTFAKDFSGHTVFGGVNMKF